MLRARWFALLGPASMTALLATGCDEESEQADSAEQPEASAAPARPASLGSAKPPAAKTDITWDAPDSWKPMDSDSPVRVATYEVPPAAGDESAELAVFYFGPESGGGVEANIKRWVGQFRDVGMEQAERSERRVNDLRQHILQIDSGTFLSGMPRGPKEPESDYALLAAIVEAPRGSHFFKLTGPEKTVHRARDAFFDMLDSVRIEHD